MENKEMYTNDKIVQYDFIWYNINLYVIINHIINS